jgi:hypothetical protein
MKASKNKLVNKIVASVAGKWSAEEDEILLRIYSTYINKPFSEKDLNSRILGTTYRHILRQTEETLIYRYKNDIIGRLRELGMITDDE